MPSTVLSPAQIRERIIACHQAAKDALRDDDLTTFDAMTEAIDTLLEQLPHQRVQ